MKQILLLAAILFFNGMSARSQYWQPVSSGTNKRLVSISFGSPRVGYIAGADSTLLRSLDGGVSWSLLSHRGLSFSLANPDIIHVNFVDAGTGFAIVGSLAFPTYSGSLYKTTDSGQTWHGVATGNIAASRTFFFDADNGYEIGSAFFAGKTVIRQTGGVWAPEQMFSYAPDEFLYGIDFRNRNTGIVGGHGGYVYRTFDGGITWDTVKTLVDSMINDLKFFSDHTIIAGSDENGGAILVSYDTGRSWHMDINTLTFSYPDIKGLAVSKRDSFIAVGHASFGNMGIILWQDGAFANNFSTSQRLNAVDMRDDSVAYIVGDSGTIFSNRMAFLGLHPAAGQGPQILVYPNPASEACYTKSDYPHTLRLYDALGRLVRTKDAPAAAHTITLRDLSPGIFLLQALPDRGAPVLRKLIVE